MAYPITEKLSPFVSVLKRLRPHHSGALSFLLIVSVALNSMLAFRLNETTSRLNETTSRLNKITAKPAKRNVLKPGMTVNGFSVKSIDGQNVSISYNESQKPTILYFLSTSCAWCGYNIMNLKKLSESVGDKYRVSVMSILSLPESPSTADLQNYRDHIAKYNSLKLTIYDAPSLVKDEYLLVEVPATVVVSPKGEVLKVWFGAYRGDIRRDIENYFGLTLPGIAEIQ